MGARQPPLHEELALQIEHRAPVGGQWTTGHQSSRSGPLCIKPSVEGPVRERLAAWWAGFAFLKTVKHSGLQALLSLC